MSRKVYCTVTVKMILQCEDDVDVHEAVNEMDYNFVKASEGVEIIDTEVTDCEITDSK